MARRVLHGYDGRFTALPWAAVEQHKGFKTFHQGMYEAREQVPGRPPPCIHEIAGDKRHNHTLFI